MYDTLICVDIYCNEVQNEHCIPMNIVYHAFGIPSSAYRENGISPIFWFREK